MQCPQKKNWENVNRIMQNNNIDVIRKELINRWVCWAYVTHFVITHFLKRVHIIRSAHTIWLAQLHTTAVRYTCSYSSFFLFPFSFNRDNDLSIDFHAHLKSYRSIFDWTFALVWWANNDYLSILDAVIKCALCASVIIIIRELKYKYVYHSHSISRRKWRKSWEVYYILRRLR